MYYNFHTRSNSRQLPVNQTYNYVFVEQNKAQQQTTSSRNIMFKPPLHPKKNIQYSPFRGIPIYHKNQEIHHKVIRETTKGSTHKQYFEKPEIRLIKPISVNSRNKYQLKTPSEQSTSAQLSQITYKPEPVSLDWNYIRRKTDTNIFKNINFGCYVEQPRKVSSFCNCFSPCSWAQRWSKWAKMPKQSIYDQLKQRPLQKQADQQIKKDLLRTHSGSRVMQFSYQRMLRQILQIYSKYDEVIGYVQGMNMIASAILYHVKDPEQTFWILVDVMERRQFKELYINDFQKLRVHTNNINRLVEYKINDLYLHLITNDVQLEMITTGWFLSMMCNIIPLADAHLMIDMFITQGFPGFYKVIMTYLLYLKQQIMLKDDSSDILSRFSSTYKQQDTDWEQILKSSINFKLN